MRTRCRTWGFTTVIALGIAPAWAQSPSDSLRAPADALRIADVARNDQMRLRTFGDRCLDGNFVELLPRRRLRLDVPNGNVPLDSIAGLWIRERQVRRGALWGAGAGLLAGALVSWKQEDIRYAFYGPFFGAFAGGVIAIPSERWRPIALSPALVSHQPCDPRSCFGCVIAQLDRGTPLRVQSTAGLLEGEVTRTSELGFTLDTDAGPTDVVRKDIQRLWAYERATNKGAKIGFLIGAPIGGVGLGLLFAAVSQLFCEGDCDTSAVSAGLAGVATGIVLGGSAGAVIGGLAGSVAYTWVEIPRGGAP